MNNPNPDAVRIVLADLSAICHAVNVPQSRDSVELHNLPLTITVKCCKTPDGDIVNDIKGYAAKATASGMNIAPPAQTSAAPDPATIPPWPPSVNHYYRHVGPRVLISRDGRKYRESVIARFRNSHVKKYTGPVELFIELYPPDNRRRDADNSMKSLLDAFTHAGLYDNDSQVYKLTIVKREPMPPNGMTYVRINEWNGDKTTENAAK